MLVVRGRARAVITACIGMILVAVAASAAPPAARLRVTFAGARITTLASGKAAFKLPIEDRAWTIDLRDGDAAIHLDRDSCGSPTLTSTDALRTAIYRSAGWTVQETTEFRPEWGFFARRLAVSRQGARPFHIVRVTPFRARLGIRWEAQRFREGAFLRFGPSAPVGTAFVLLQNPYLQWESAGDAFALSYAPDMDWNPAWGAFQTDRVCYGLAANSGRRVPAVMTPEWKWAPEASPNAPTVDMAEVEAVTECAQAFLQVHPKRALRVHIGWCENDYQIDIATPEGRTQYRRLIDRAAQVGCRYLLFTPANSALAPLSENRDAWGWENVLWLTIGQKLRKGEWNPERDPVPANVQEMLDYAKARDVKLLAYVYPTLPFKQNPEWMAWLKGREPGGYLGADTGVRSFQDWLVDKLVAFHRRTGVAGFSFDHWWIAYDDASSKYQQWYGCRRILEELRRRIPDVVIDGRQQYHQFGVSTWFAGSYPHPLGNDEQPQSFRAFPDLHFDRVTADRQRWMAWNYRIRQFCPTEILPGFLFHQTTRFDEQNQLRRDSFRTRDWDMLGWRYSVISSIATAPFNSVVNFLPARDAAEFAAFDERQRAWLRSWLDWTDAHLDVLRHVRPILDQPAVGKVDGTAAFVGAKGYIFLFNPNYREMNAVFHLDESLGMRARRGAPLALRQLYPEAGRGRVFSGSVGAQMNMPLAAAEALVLEVEPLLQPVTTPILLNTVGRARLNDGRLELTGIAGQPGETVKVQAILPAGASVRQVTVNRVPVSFECKDRLLSVVGAFRGAPFHRNQQIGVYDPTFTGGVSTAVASVPGRIFRQLLRRRADWPVRYTPDDLLATWLGSDRLLLYLNIADADDKMAVSLRIDDKPVALTPAYSSVYPQSQQTTFIGWYADVSTLRPEIPHRFEVALPTLRPGQFQGLFFDNVETEMTTDFEPQGAPVRPQVNAAARPRKSLSSGMVRTVEPPEKGFFAKETDYQGIPIKASAVVEDRALLIARERLSRLLQHLPDAVYNLKVAGAELHIIGRDQGTSDLPEHRHLKGKPFDGNLTVDQRTRGLGGLLTSCGEENLLELPGDRYRGRDICLHEFSHNLQDNGFSEDVQQMIREQYRRSLAKGLWNKAYAATNEHEFWAELTMWYFGTHGDMGMTGVKPANGAEGLKAYDPEAYDLLDSIYSGRVPVKRVAVEILKPLPPAREKDLRSGQETKPVTIDFVNRTGEPVSLYWIDPMGKRQPYGVLDPGDRDSRNTFRSHVWLAARPNGEAIALFVAGTRRGLARIGEP